MADDAIYAFSEEDAEDILDATDQVLADPRLSGQREPRAPRRRGYVLAVARATSSTATSGRYPGRLVYYDPNADTWTDVSGSDDCWLKGFNGEALFSGQRYLCINWGPLNNDGLAVLTPVAIDTTCADIMTNWSCSAGTATVTRQKFRVVSGPACP